MKIKVFKTKSEKDARIRKLEKRIVKDTKELAAYASQPGGPGQGPPPGP